jgi:valyl-tRNA synthetase
MRGKEVFYPVGWDDNGLATERRVQNYYGVRCDPSLPYKPGFTPPALGNGRPLSPADQVPVSRRNFVELCRQLTELDETTYAQAWRRLGLSVDWDVSYRTIDDRVQAVSQLAFLRNLARGEAYQAEAPALWDVTFGTAVAQAEIEDRETPGTFIRLAFVPTDQHGTERASTPASAAQPGEVVVATTRPELLPACVALVAHPDDERYSALFGSMATTPLFGVQVPILAHRLADPAKGTGLVMVCTFGDMTDVTWWRDLRLDTRPVIGKDGRLLADPPPGITSPAGVAAYERIARQSAKAARQLMTDMLHAGGHVRGEPEPIRHAVKFYEYGQAPLEIITTRQWYIRNGSRSKDLANALLSAGRQLHWHPDYMRTRYEHWLEGLTGDWLISRQRYRGVPIPVWYSLDGSGRIEEGKTILPTEADLPVDPAADAPAGYRPDQRGEPGGFAADPDVMDTWATSSLTPQIAGGWPADEDLMRRVFPMDLRPQAHEIIRTWLFYTVLRSHDEHGLLPWRHAAISGWILDPDRKKMSKSKGNAVTPMDLLREHGTDAVRYWATSARLGVDTAFDLAQIKIGRRLAIKILNAGRFVLGFEPPGDAAAGTFAADASAESPAAADASAESPAAADASAESPAAADASAASPSAADASAESPAAASASATITEPIDLALLRRLADVVERCTAALVAYEQATALEQAERFFWFFCDDYLELVKARAYGEHGQAAAASAAATLRTGLSVVLRLLAPFLPFVTEEVWSWWQDGSLHRASWPDPAALRAAAGPGDDTVLEAAAAAIAAIRKAKSQARVPMKNQIPLLILTAGHERLDALAAARHDVQAAGHVDKIELRAAPGTGSTHEVVV